MENKITIRTEFARNIDVRGVSHGMMVRHTNLAQFVSFDDDISKKELADIFRSLADAIEKGGNDGPKTKKAG